MEICLLSSHLGAKLDNCAGELMAEGDLSQFFINGLKFDRLINFH